MLSLETLADQLNLELRNPQPHAEITHLASIASAQPGSLVFATDAAQAKSALESPATAIILHQALADQIPVAPFKPSVGLSGRSAASQTPTAKALILSTNPRLDFARAAQLLRAGEPPTGVHPAAIIDPTATVPATASIAATAVIAAHATLGEHTTIAEGAIIGEGVTIGAHCHIYPRAVLYPGTTLGDRVIVQVGAVLGADGYGYVRDPATGQYLQFPQQGKLLIEDDVEIGANTCIDRGALDATIIRRGAKLDNLIHLGHNVIVGENVLIAAQTGISGSTTIGDNAIIGGQVGIGDHARIGENVILGSQAGVLPGKKLRATGEILWGTPAQPLKHILKELGLLRRLRRSSERDESQ
jgi:UDP-3-O-[3-hydroxymyristoyl] glucosamine N-acyltransferase